MSNESIDHLLRAAGIGHPASKDRLVSSRIRQRSIMVRTDAKRTGCRAKGQGTVPVNDASLR